jgi:hypothetical protein
MGAGGTDHNADVYKITCDNGCSFVVYDASAIGNPGDHHPDRWYVRPYPVKFRIEEEVAGPFDSAQEAERATRLRHARRIGAPRAGSQPQGSPTENA